MKCIECNKKMTSMREVYHYTESGLDNVYLDTDVHTCAKCRESVVDIPNIYGLHEMVAEGLVKKPYLLKGKEIRFIRKFLHLKAVELAKILGVDKVTVSRWENDTAQISVANDKLIRLIYVQKYQEKCDIILEIMKYIELIRPTTKSPKITISKEDMQKAPACSF